MEWTSADKDYLLNLRNVIDDDNLKIKEQVKKKLVNNKYIIHLLNNKELEESEAEPEDYFGCNILPYYLIAPTQTHVDNFICFETQFKEEGRYNPLKKYQQLIFYILCHNKNAIDEETSLARHDLLAMLIKNEFNWTNVFGSKIHCISDVGGVVDTDYTSRTLTFEQITDNEIVKTRNGIPQIINKEVHT